MRPGWILGARADLAIFTGPIVVAGLFIAWAWSNGTLHKDMPPWMFAALVIACDVAHVYATAFRVYLDPERFRQRPGLYLGVPLGCFAAGVVLYGLGGAVFWRILAYLAVWHFIRQQWGWVAYARAKAGEGANDRRLDQVTIYAATLYPLIHWHTHLPRDFSWFIEGDFVALPAVLSGIAMVGHWLVMLTFVARQIQRQCTGVRVNWAKVQIVVTTWIAWYGGIVALNSDVAFTALNILSHGVPYLAVVWSVERGYVASQTSRLARWFQPRLAVLLLAALVLVGYVEEWLWDALVWKDHGTLFLSITEHPLSVGMLGLVVPLLATPQATHYVLDGWLWKRGQHRDLDAFLSPD